MTWRRLLKSAAVTAAVVIAMSGDGAAAQQSAMATLPEEPPAVVLYRLGPVLVNPKLTVPEIGHDSNAFNEAATPRADFVIKFTPAIDFFTDVGLLRVAVQSATAFSYYHRFESERSIAEQVRGRVTARLSRVRPWLGGASLRSNERTTEIDARAMRSDREIAAGVQFDVSPMAAVTLSASRNDLAYSGVAAYRDTLLAPVLDRRTEMVTAAMRWQATPFTTVTVSGYAGREAFAVDTTRNADTRGGEVEVSFSPEAIIRGRLTLGFRQQNFDDPTLTTFRGLNGRGGITTVFSWRAMLGVDYMRELQYSFDRADGYYLENGADVVYTQRIGGPFDLQARVGRRALDYGARVGGPARAETLRAYQGGVGFSLENGSRVGLNYELAERIGDATGDRAFLRRRIFGSFTYEFWK